MTLGAAHEPGHSCPGRETAQECAVSLSVYCAKLNSFAKRHFERDSNNFFANVGSEKRTKGGASFLAIKSTLPSSTSEALLVIFPSRQLPNDHSQVKK